MSWFPCRHEPDWNTLAALRDCVTTMQSQPANYQDALYLGASIAPPLPTPPPIHRIGYPAAPYSDGKLPPEMAMRSSGSTSAVSSASSWSTVHERGAEAGSRPPRAPEGRASFAGFAGPTGPEDPGERHKQRVSAAVARPAPVPREADLYSTEGTSHPSTAVTSRRSSVVDGPTAPTTMTTATTSTATSTATSLVDAQRLWQARRQHEAQDAAPSPKGTAATVPDRASSFSSSSSSAAAAAVAMPNSEEARPSWLFLDTRTPGWEATAATTRAVAPPAASAEAVAATTPCARAEPLPEPRGSRRCDSPPPTVTAPPSTQDAVPHRAPTFGAVPDTPRSAPSTVMDSVRDSRDTPVGTPHAQPNTEAESNPTYVVEEVWEVVEEEAEADDADTHIEEGDTQLDEKADRSASLPRASKKRQHISCTADVAAPERPLSDQPRLVSMQRGPSEVSVASSARIQTTGTTATTTTTAASSFRFSQRLSQHSERHQPPHRLPQDELHDLHDHVAQKVPSRASMSRASHASHTTTATTAVAPSVHAVPVHARVSMSRDRGISTRSSSASSLSCWSATSSAASQMLNGRVRDHLQRADSVEPGDDGHPASPSPFSSVARATSDSGERQRVTPSSREGDAPPAEATKQATALAALWDAVRALQAQPHAERADRRESLTRARTYESPEALAEAESDADAEAVPVAPIRRVRAPETTEESLAAPPTPHTDDNETDMHDGACGGGTEDGETCASPPHTPRYLTYLTPRGTHTVRVVAQTVPDAVRTQRDGARPAHYEYACYIAPPFTAHRAHDGDDIDNDDNDDEAPCQLLSHTPSTVDTWEETTADGEARVHREAPETHLSDAVPTRPGPALLPRSAPALRTHEPPASLPRTPLAPAPLTESAACTTPSTPPAKVGAPLQPSMTASVPHTAPTTTTPPPTPLPRPQPQSAPLRRSSPHTAPRLPPLTLITNPTAPTTTTATAAPAGPSPAPASVPAKVTSSETDTQDDVVVLSDAGIDNTSASSHSVRARGSPTAGADAKLSHTGLTATWLDASSPPTPASVSCASSVAPFSSVSSHKPAHTTLPTTTTTAAAAVAAAVAVSGVRQPQPTPSAAVVSLSCRPQQLPPPSPPATPTSSSRSRAAQPLTRPLPDQQHHPQQRPPQTPSPPQPAVRVSDEEVHTQSASGTAVQEAVRTVPAADSSVATTTTTSSASWHALHPPVAAHDTHLGEAEARRLGGVPPPSSTVLGAASVPGSSRGSSSAASHLAPSSTLPSTCASSAPPPPRGSATQAGLTSHAPRRPSPSTSEGVPARGSTQLDAAPPVLVHESMAPPAAHDGRGERPQPHTDSASFDDRLDAYAATTDDGSSATTATTASSCAREQERTVGGAEPPASVVSSISAPSGAEYASRGLSPLESREASHHVEGGDDDEGVSAVSSALVPVVAVADEDAAVIAAAMAAGGDSPAGAGVSLSSDMEMTPLERCVYHTTPSMPQADDDEDDVPGTVDASTRHSHESEEGDASACDAPMGTQSVPWTGTNATEATANAEQNDVDEDQADRASSAPTCTSSVPEQPRSAVPVAATHPRQPSVSSSSPVDAAPSPVKPSRLRTSSPTTAKPTPSHSTMSDTTDNTDKGSNEDEEENAESEPQETSRPSWRRYTLPTPTPTATPTTAAETPTAPIGQPMLKRYVQYLQPGAGSRSASASPTRRGEGELTRHTTVHVPRPDARAAALWQSSLRSATPCSHVSDGGSTWTSVDAFVSGILHYHRAMSDRTVTTLFDEDTADEGSGYCGGGGTYDDVEL